MNFERNANGIEKKDLAFEMKFLLPQEKLEKALSWGRANLGVDPMANVYTSDVYRVTSIYLDTPNLDTFRRVGSFGRAKYRVRRYADETTVFLERKIKTNGVVGKRRVRVPDNEIGHLASPQVNPGWAGFWFFRRISAREISPRCQISYERVARVGPSANGSIRLTVDRNIQCWPSNEWAFTGMEGGKEILPGMGILELKYQGQVPAAFRGLIEMLAVERASISKYRLGIKAMGMEPPPVNGHAVALPVSGESVSKSASST